MNASGPWSALTAPPPLARGEVHLWRVKVPDASAVPSPWLALLTAEEQERVARKRIPLDGRRTLASRACLRLLLGAYLARPPAEIALTATPGGKPLLADAPATDRLEFNVSHSDEWILLGFSRGLPLGVDVERHRELEFDDLVKGFFSPPEREQWAALTPAQRPDAFFAAWTRKEAYLKALGIGLAKSLDTFSVAFGPDAAPALLGCADDALAPQRWRLVPLALAPGYAGALAVASSADRLQTFTFQYTSPPPGDLSGL